MKIVALFSFALLAFSGSCNANLGYKSDVDKQRGPIEIWYQSAAAGYEGAGVYVCMKHPFVFKSSKGEPQTIGCHSHERDWWNRTCYFTKFDQCPEFDVCMSKIKYNVKVREPRTKTAVYRTCYYAAMDEFWLSNSKPDRYNILDHSTYNKNNSEANSVMDLLTFTGGTTKVGNDKISIWLYTAQENGWHPHPLNDFIKLDETPVAVK
ncbi:hypothetical protein ACQY0O_002514 [Thecaphora frezii]